MLHALFSSKALLLFPSRSPGAQEWVQQGSKGAGHRLSPASCPPHSKHNKQRTPPPSQFNYTLGKARPCVVHLGLKKRGSLKYLRDSKIWMTIFSATSGSSGYFIQAKTC